MRKQEQHTTFWRWPPTVRSFLLLVVRPGAPSSFLLLGAMPSLRVASCYVRSNGLQPTSDGLHTPHTNQLTAESSIVVRDRLRRHGLHVLPVDGDGAPREGGGDPLLEPLRRRGMRDGVGSENPTDRPEEEKSINKTCVFSRKRWRRSAFFSGEGLVFVLSLFWRNINYAKFLPSLSGRTTRSKKLLATKGIATDNKEAIRG